MPSLHGPRPSPLATLARVLAAYDGLLAEDASPKASLDAALAVRVREILAQVHADAMTSSARHDPAFAARIAA